VDEKSLNDATQTVSRFTAALDSVRVAESLLPLQLANGFA